MDIATLFEINNIKFRKVDAVGKLGMDSLPESIVSYLECMGTAIKLHETSYGSAYTTLFSMDEMKQEQDAICSQRGLLIIGCGLNGDLITINVENMHVGYVFHDDLWEENYEVIDDIYIELPFEIDTFLDMALKGIDYPIDGTMAEKYNLE